MTTPPEYDAAVRAWAAALRAGATTTWSDFNATPIEAPAGLATSGPLPGAAQLEILRRLAALHAAAPIPRFGDLADLVLTSVGPGRGLVDPPLPWPEPTARYGPDPVEPDRLPANELVRACLGVLVPLLLSSEARPAPLPGPARWRRYLPGSRRFVVAGSPGTAAAVRRALLEAGWSEGGKRAKQLVLGRDLETMMAEHWVARTRIGVERRWRPLWRQAVSSEQLPPRLQLDEISARRAAEHGPDAVHLIIGRDEAEIERGVLEALGVRIRLERVVADVVAADLLRRLNPLLVLAAGADARRTATLGPWSAALERPGTRGEPPLIGAPPGLLPWGIAAADRMAVQVTGHLAVQVPGEAGRGDYSVHGDPAALVPDRDRELVRAVDPELTVGLATRIIAALWGYEATEGGE